MIAFNALQCWISSNNKIASSEESYGHGNQSKPIYVGIVLKYFVLL